MNTKPAALKQVLFVDDSPKFLQKLRAKMPTWSRDNWELLFAPDASNAFTIFETRQVDLVVIDLGVSDMESVQFLKLIHQKHPHIRKAVLSSFLEQNTRKECLQSGADMFLIKPKRTNGFEAIFHSLNQLFTLSQEGFRGLLRTISLTDLIQLECLNARSSVLEISADKQFGRVFIKHGSIIHAQAGSKTGVDAFIRLMHMAGGDFNLKPFVDPGIRTIDMSCDRLLLETSHAVDNRRAQEHVESDSGNNTTWLHKDSRELHPPLANETQCLDAPAESINFLQIAEPSADPTDFFPASALRSQPTQGDLVTLNSIMELTDELIANRSLMDMNILDLALLKEELNSCKSRLVEVIAQMQERADSPQYEHSPKIGDNLLPALNMTESGNHGTAINPETKQVITQQSLSGFIESLNMISQDTSDIVRQLDGYFATFTEESGGFNETSAKLQNAISRLQETSAIPQ
jgi:CheY-like chemotaxis protein